MTAPQKPTKPMFYAAERHFHDGVKFTEEGNYEAARICFKSGYKLSGEPDLVYNLSRTCEKAGRLKEATEYAARYQSLVVGTEEEEERARRRVEFLRGRYSVEQAQPKAPEQQPANPEEQTPTKPSASGPSPQTRPKPPPAPRQARRDPAKHTKPPGAIGLLAGGGALALAGVGLLAGAWATGNQAVADGTTYADWAALNDKGRALNTGGIVLSVVGGALAVGGVIWAIVPIRKAQAQPEIAE